MTGGEKSQLKQKQDAQTFIQVIQRGLNEKRIIIHSDLALPSFADSCEYLCYILQSVPDFGPLVLQLHPLSCSIVVE